MKRIKIAFSLKEYQKGIYEVETVGDDLPEKVRIVCTDRNVKTGKTKNMPRKRYSCYSDDLGEEDDNPYGLDDC